MPRLTARVLVIPLAAAVGYGIACVDPATLRDREPDTEAGIDPVLKQRLANNHAMVAYKDYLVRELVAGRMTLAEVADEFLRVNAEEPAILETVLRDHPGADDRERSAHNVIAFACGRCLTQTEESELRARLATEFAGAFGHRPAAGTT